MKLILLTFALLLLSAKIRVFGYKILGICSPVTYSHFSLSFTIMKELANRGHEVTFINNFPQETPIKNLRDISVKGLNTYIKGAYDNMKQFAKLSHYDQMISTVQVGKKHTESFLNHTNVQKFIQSNEQFDLVILHHFFNDALVAFAHKFKAPLIILSPWELNYLNSYLMANPIPVSYITYTAAEYGPRMTFWQRLNNAYNQIITELFMYHSMIPEQNKLLKKAFPNAPDLESILYNASLMFTASHLSLSQPQPVQPNVKSIGGYHIKPPKPLPKDLEDFMNKSTEGVVVFSMGSIVKSARFEPKQIKGILKAFSRLKQNVLWKFEEDLQDVPSNVKIIKWMPQSDVLAHPNTVVFISHCGLLGTTEAVYHGVPLIGIPVFWDQFKNVEMAMYKGFALKINLDDLDESTMYSALNEIINNPSYKLRAKELSLVMRDQPLKQLDEAIFWIEYVIRHKGAPHLRSTAMELRWYQLYSVDIVLFCIFLIFIVSSILFYCVRKAKPVIDVIKKNN